MSVRTSTAASAGFRPIDEFLAAPEFLGRWVVIELEITSVRAHTASAFRLAWD